MATFFDRFKTQKHGNITNVVKVDLIFARAAILTAISTHHFYTKWMIIFGQASSPNRVTGMIKTYCAGYGGKNMTAALHRILHKAL